MVKTKALFNRKTSWTLFYYVVRETLLAFFAMFLFYFLIFTLNNFLLYAREILAKRVPVFQVMLFIFYLTPQVIAMSAPFASLTGTLITIGRLNSDNEVVVMLASGLSYKVVFLPALLVGILISSLSFITNDILLPAGSIRSQRLYRSILFSTPALELEANSIRKYRNTVIVTGAVTGREIENLIILDRTSDGERRVIMAGSAELNDSEGDGLSLDLGNAFFISSKEIVRDDYDYALADFLSYRVPENDLLQGPAQSINANQMSSLDLSREITAMTAERNERMDEYFSRSMPHALNLEESLRQGPKNEMWNQRGNYLGLYFRDLESALSLLNNARLLLYQTEFYKKFSIPFGALAFVLLAVSLGLTAKKNGQIVGFIFGALVSIIYWALLLGGQQAAIRFGYSPFWAMWLPDILSLLAGFALFVARLLR